MSLITAKFNSRCPVCNEFINAGDQVEWTKGSKAKHPACVKGEQKIAHRSNWRASNTQQSSPRSEGKLEGKYTCVRRGKAAATVGETSWLLKGKDRILVTTVGWSTQYVREDGLSFGMPEDSGWFTTCYARAATEEEKAPLLAAEVAKKTELEAKAREAKEKEEAFKAGREALIAGLVKTTCRPAELGEGKIILEGRDCAWKIALVQIGEWISESCYAGSDDYRQYYYGPESAVRESVRDWAARNGIDRVKAVAWLEQYRGCEGTSDYEIAATLES